MTSDLRDLLLGAVPPPTAPRDRLARVARLARRRRRQQVAARAVAVGLVVAGVVVVPRLPLWSASVKDATPAATGSATGADRSAEVPTPSTSASGGDASPTATAHRSSPASSSVAALPGRAYDRSAVPPPIAGSAAQRIAPTTKKPDPSDVGIFQSICTYARFAAEDPLRAPGRVGGAPLQVFWGNTTGGASSATGSATARGNSTCHGGVLDRSVYWAPALIDTATGRPLAPSVIHVFYKSGYHGLHAKDISPFPAGLRLLADDPGSPLGADFVGWQCWTGGDGKVTATIPQCPVGSAVAMTVGFQQCWDGHELDSPDHRSHVVHPQNLRCPASHPVALPEISYHLVYPVTAGTDTSTWRLSTDLGPVTPGRAGGAGITGGWIDGWRTDIANTWGMRCIHAQLDCHTSLLGDGREVSGDV